MFPFFNPSIDNNCMTACFCSKAFLNGWTYADETYKFHTGELNVFEIFANAPQVTLRIEAEANPAAIWTEADSSALGFFFEAGFDYHRQRRKKSDALNIVL